MANHTPTNRQRRQMRRSQAWTMEDVANHQQRTMVQSPSGAVTSTWETRQVLSCGFEFSPFKFRSRELETSTEGGDILVRARVSYPDHLLIKREDRLELVSRLGIERVPTEIYEVQGFLEVGPSAAIVNLRRLEF